MKTSLKSLFCAVTLAASFGGHAATLTVKISEFTKAVGKMGVQLVDSQAAYDGKGKPIAAQMVEVKSTDPLTLTFSDLKPGTYAVMVMHDENGNGKLDSNMLGIPKEGYGFSNNPRVMRRPNFDETKFDVKAADISIAVEIL
jgi:uncharacterized protein (DUF2141 family)